MRCACCYSEVKGKAVLLRRGKAYQGTDDQYAHPECAAQSDALETQARGEFRYKNLVHRAVGPDWMAE